MKKQRSIKFMSMYIHVCNLCLCICMFISIFEGKLHSLEWASNNLHEKEYFLLSTQKRAFRICLNVHLATCTMLMGWKITRSFNNIWSVHTLFVLAIMPLRTAPFWIAIKYNMLWNNSSSWNTRSLIYSTVHHFFQKLIHNIKFNLQAYKILIVSIKVLLI